MKKILFLFFISVSFGLQAQIIKPIEWSAVASEGDAIIGKEITLVFQASIQENWFLYSSDFDPDCGPILTTFEFKKNDSYSLVGGIVPVGAKTKFSDVFECDYNYFTKIATFKQRILLHQATLNVEATNDYQVCSNVDGKCIPFDESFRFTIPDVKTANLPKTIPAKKEPETPVQTKKTAKDSSLIKKEPTEKEIESTQKKLKETKTQNTTETVSTEEGTFPLIKYPSFFDAPPAKEKENHFAFMLIAFIAGLAAIFTPCVFPMIPMTVSYFTSKGSKGHALIYGLSIVVIYTLFGALTAPFMGPQTANHLATEWIPNLIFFLVFVLFALSFFGAFDITLPSGLVNKMDEKADKGGLLGVFFMAFTLVLVSFSCTGPIVGSLLVESAGGAVLKPILGMMAFSAAFAIPFSLFALFPGLMKNLPKSGGWLNSVKVVLGFIELALAFKFLSIADQAYHWGILDRDLNIAIWIVLAILLGFYLLGKIKLPHDSPMENIGVFRLLLSIVVFTFAIYLVPGLFGAPLKSLSGYLPPMNTHDFDLLGKIREDGKDQSLQIEGCPNPEYADFLHLPHGLKGFFKYEQAVACSKEQNKPIFIDFTGHGCTNCREMEAKVWSDPQVLKLLKDEFVILALYVDDKTELPIENWYVSAYDNKIKKTIGKQNADFQIQRANNNAQPNYLIIGQDRSLIDPIGREDSETFQQFLEKGIAAFKKPQKP